MHSFSWNNVIQRTITGIILGGIFWTLLVYLPPLYFSITLCIILVCIILFEWQRLFSIAKPAFWITMPLYPVLPFALLIALNQDQLCRPLLYILFMLVFSFDTGSYIVGTTLGRHPLCPSISKHKTWEGVAGGYFFALIGLYFIVYEQHLYITIPFGMLFTAFVCALSLLGDLFESWLKRRAQIKDAGTMLPGHGGFLDRFDGIMFAVFFFYLLRTQLMLLFYA